MAPKLTNCVTAICYLCKRLRLPMPYAWIGDMPRILVTKYGCRILRLNVHETRTGDLVFFKHRKTQSLESTEEHARYFRHIGLFVNPGCLFHSSDNREGAVIEDLLEPSDLYVKNLMLRTENDIALTLRYVDPRNEHLREKYGVLHSFSVPRPVNIFGRIDLEEKKDDEKLE